MNSEHVHPRVTSDAVRSLYVDIHGPPSACHGGGDGLAQVVTYAIFDSACVAMTAKRDEDRTLQPALDDALQSTEMAAAVRDTGVPLHVLREWAEEILQAAGRNRPERGSARRARCDAGATKPAESTASTTLTRWWLMP